MNEPQEAISNAPSCPTCAIASPPIFDRADRVTAESIRKHEHLFSLTPDAPDGHTHTAQELVGFYELAPWVKCSFPDRRAHAKGYAIVTCCGRRIRIGHCCGTRWLTNFKYLEEVERQVRGHVARTQVLAHAPRELIRRLQATASFVQQAERFWGDVKTYLPGVHAEIQRRKKLPVVERKVFYREVKVAASVSEAFSDRFGDRKGRRRDVASEQRLEIAGLGISDPRLRSATLDDLLADGQAVAVAADLALVDTANAVAVEKAYRRVDEFTSRAEDFLALVEDAHLFCTDSNLDLVVEAARASGVKGKLTFFRARRNHFTIEMGGELHVLGLDGLRPEATA